MGNARQSQNIFRCIKEGNWSGAWYWITHFDKLTFEDTFMPLVCGIVGHKKYQPDPEADPTEWACRRCHRWIQ